MQEIVDRILEGNFDYENGSLDFSCTNLEFSLPKDQIYEGGFQVYGTPNQYTVGYVSSSDIRMECLTTEFVGNEEEIRFRFHAHNLEEGEVIKGEFYIISNRGEYRIPYVARVEASYPVSSVGEIKNLFHFANLAKSNWEEAVRIFYSPEFDKIVREKEKQYYGGYLGLSSYPGNEQNLEEFLLLINKKQKIEYITEEKQLVLDNPLGVTELQLNIVQNGWGHTYLEVETDGEFLYTEKEVLTDNDFLGNRCRLSIYVDSNLLHNGRNYGSITLRNSYACIHVPVTVADGDDSGTTGGMYLGRKRNLVQLMEYYQAFRLKKISSSTWLKETGKLVEIMVNRDDGDVEAALFWAHILITRERYNEASWLLEQTREKYEKADREYPVLEAYYMYLTTLIRRDEEYTRDIAERVRRLYYEQNDEWRLAWLLLYLSEDLNRDASARWSFLAQQFYQGCTSPMLYVEAMNLLNTNPTLLRRLSRFEVQVMYYGVRRDVLHPEVVEQFCYLIQRVKDYSRLLYKILESCYAKNQDIRIVREICTLLIKGGKTGKEYFEWYRLGVEAELRITKLYEYYMMSLDMELGLELPKILLLYFMYQNNLDYVRCAYLYCYVIHKKDAYPDIYVNYLPKIERFVIEQIQKEHINRDLASLYRDFVTEGMLNKQTASALSRLIFAYELKIKNPEIKNVIVYQPGNLLETVYPVNHGETWVAYYNDECVIVFEDSKGVRFIQGIDYTMERLMLSGKYIEQVAMVVEDCPEFDLYVQQNCAWSEEATVVNLARWKRILDAPYLSDEIKRDVLFRVLNYYAEREDTEQLAFCLEKVDGRMLTPRERGNMVQYYLMVNQYDTAYDWICTYGMDYVEGQLAVQILEERIATVDYGYESGILFFIYELYKMGRMSNTTLQYLFYYCDRSIEELIGLWQVGMDWEMDCYYLSEKLLLRMLFSGNFLKETPEIFAYYLTGKTDADLVEACLAKNAYDYFVNGSREMPQLPDAITDRFARGEAVQRICKLAYLKYYSEHQEEIDDRRKAAVSAFLKEFLDQRVYMKFFLQFNDHSGMLEDMRDRTIVEYKAHPESRVKIHYVITSENGEADDYFSEEMEPVYGGIFVKDFILFFGETLQYYITEEYAGEESLTENAVIQKSDIGYAEKRSAYHMINDMIMSKTLQDYENLEEGMQEYYRTQFMNRNLFTLE